MRLTLSAVVVLAAVVAAVAEGEVPVVATEGGRVSGVKEESTKGKVFYSYYGIPFAKPPVGFLRLQDPEPADTWEGVRDGSIMPEPCIQVPFEGTLTLTKIPPEGLQGTEDCLYLNVFTPKTAGGEARSSLPVIVWIHGGGFTFGGAQEYLPHVLMNQEVVLVVIQYRLGILGFLSTEDSAIPGNFGLKDQTLALQWVQRNIHNFGGDKTKVTIAGESAGGAAVHYQMLTPKSKGLFSRVIMMSGTAICPWSVSRSHDQTSKRVGKAVYCPIHSGSLVLLRCLQNLDPYKLSAVGQEQLEWYMFPLVFLPYVDGDYLPAEPAQLVREGRVNHVDVMGGVTSHEGLLMAAATFVQPKLRELLESNFDVAGPASVQSGDETHNEDPLVVAKAIYRYYFGDDLYDARQKSDFERLMSDRHFMVCHDWATEYHARTQPPNTSVYRYELTRRSELSLGDIFGLDPDDRLVFHGDDLFYLFRGGPLLQPPYQPVSRARDLSSQDDLALRELLTTLWVNFAATGNPTPDDSLGFIWEPSTGDNLQYLDINLSPSMEADQRQEVRRFHASLPTKINLALHPHLMDDTPAKKTTKTPGTPVKKTKTADNRRGILDEL